MLQRTLARLLPALFSFIAAAAAQTPLPVEAFFEKASVSAAELSPDGRALAFRIDAKGSRARLAVLDLATMKPSVVGSFADADIGDFRWVNDGRLVFDLQVELDGPGTTFSSSGLFAVNADGGEFRQVVQTRRSFLSEGAVSREPLPIGVRLLESLGKQDSSEVLALRDEGRGSNEKYLTTLLRVNTKTLSATEIDAPLGAVDWRVDAEGRLRAVVTVQGDRTTLQYRDVDGPWRVLAQGDNVREGVPWPVHVGGDGQLYVTSSAGRDKAALFAYDLANKRLPDKPLLELQQYDLHPQFIVDDRQLLGLRYTADAEVTHWLDPALQALQEAVDGQLKGLVNRISVARRPRTNFVLVESYSDRQPLLFHLYDKETKKLVRIGAAHPAIDRRQMGKSDLVRFPARDGLEIPAWLTLPPGEAQGKRPLVVLVHGGPWVRGAEWGWHPEVQFLASRGYAVLEPEFRGSTGYGRRHFEAGWKQWGLAMQDDIADGTRWAIAKGIADAQRICIGGASYGGYATLMGLIRDPDLYRCGFEWVGVTDIELMYSVDWSDISDAHKKYGMPVLVGDREKDAAQLKATSPLANAARLKAPLLMAYGGFDVRVPLVHGEKFRDAVKATNSDVEWVVYDKEGHGWRDPKNAIDFWKRVEAFLARNIGAPR